MISFFVRSRTEYTRLNFVCFCMRAGMGACSCHGAMLLLLLAPLLSSSMEAGAKTRSSMKYDVSDKPSRPEPQSRAPLDGFESSPRPGRPFISRNDRIPNLLRWLKQQGIDHKSINLEDGQGNCKHTVWGACLYDRGPVTSPIIDQWCANKERALACTVSMQLMGLEYMLRRI